MYQTGDLHPARSQKGPSRAVPPLQRNLLDGQFGGRGCRIVLRTAQCAMERVLLAVLLALSRPVMRQRRED